MNLPEKHDLTIDLSKETIEVMKNFSWINNNILIEKGNKLRTMADNQAQFAIAEVAETFPVDFGIYDLSNFIGVVSMFDEPVLSFSQDTRHDGLATYVIIKEKNKKSEYKFFGTPKNLIMYIDGNFNAPEFEVKGIKLDKAFISKITKMSSMSGFSHLMLKNNSGNIEALVTSLNEESSNNYVHELEYKESSNHGNFKFIFDLEMFKMVQDDYEVSIYGTVLSEFVALNKNIKYYMSINKDSESGR